MEIDGILPMMLSDARDVLVEFGPGRVPLVDLIDDWAGRVLKLFYDSRETDRDVFHEWGADDLVGALYLRDAVDRGLATLRARHLSGDIAAVRAIDELFRSMTIEDDRGLTVVEPDAPLSPWWWKRVPSRGPVVVEIEEIHRRLS